MALHHANNGQPSIDKEEHRYKNVGAKAVVLYGYDPSTDSYYPINVTPNTDGTFSLSQNTPLVTERYDYSDSNTIYAGEAPLGTADSTALWTIYKYSLSDPSAATGQVARTVAWTGRAAATYV